jgi:hypothetical protein
MMAILAAANEALDEATKIAAAAMPFANVLNAIGPPPCFHLKIFKLS